MGSSAEYSVAHMHLSLKDVSHGVSCSKCCAIWFGESTELTHALI